ncbi:hypothetical protein AKJ58_00005 [candidate division MSBL1 archaeon SCGC-AAA385D11]|uniref:Rho termination factor-like N-terminal domain-containing protein n=1 Tax=candidate division MSBL1 archaeon SCGC-AAA385D11 TaxID=1698286 RepID=A0A133VPJ8_9EURY|nr:hypothetical protein AKJ58_00005 [candidate division MSBL1 archaeon SCGC-AAA385D11]
MPTKKELLEKMTVKELKQMARNKDLSGYSTKNKSGLVEMIKDNYLKKEIKAWPKLEKETLKKVEEAPKKLTEPSKPAFTMDPAGIAMAVLIVAILLLYIYVSLPG